MLLDGHLRFEILKEIGQKEVFCLVSTDDEAFTYNHKVNRISPIQEHFMILRAIEKGVLEERIAKTLNVDIAKIRQKRNLLEGICSEVVELLKDKHFSPNAIRVLKKMKPMRQIEVAELMIAANNYTVPYAQALLAATPKDQLVEQQKPKKIEGLSPEEMARMEKETEILARDFKVVKDSYGKDTLNLVLACGYLSKLLDNSHIVRFLSKHYPDILSEFQQIIEATSLSN
jgi:ParB-like chromosome segregation protein Spo0J